MASILEFKLLVERKTQKVLFAEVHKTVVDFLLGLFALPMGSVLNLITKESTVGSLGTLYSSWKQLDPMTLSHKMGPSQIAPAISATAGSSNFSSILSSASRVTAKEIVYKCGNSKCKGSYFADVYGWSCGYCARPMYSRLSYLGTNVTMEAVERYGYVAGGFTYAVMDDLSVVPLQTALAIVSLLDKLGHKDLSLLEEKTVTMDVQAEGLGLLKASLWSKNVLTDVFLAKEMAWRKKSSELWAF